MTQADSDVCWKHPTKNKIKVNTGAALFEESNSYSYSMIARDSNGQLVEEASSCKHGNMALDMAEAIAIREALSWIKVHIWSNVEVESDYLLIIQAIRYSSGTLSYLGRVVEEYKQQLLKLKDCRCSLSLLNDS